MNADVAILTALPKELEAFLRHAGPWAIIPSRSDSIRTIYHCNTSNGISIVAACAMGMGQLNAALLARDIIVELHPKKIILVGIAGGLGDEVRLGDIVISDQIVDYELGKVTSAGTTPRWSVYRSDARLIESLIHFKDTTWMSCITASRPNNDELDNPRVHIGVVLCGNKVVADNNMTEALRSVWNRALAIEMESVGVAATLYQISDAPPFVMIKGVCDHANAKKDDRWQSYAADVSSAFTMAFLMDSFNKPSLEFFKNKSELPLIWDGIDSRVLRSALFAAFNLSELRMVAKDLGLEWEDIAGNTKSEKIIELIEHMERRSRLKDLVNLIKRDRPNLLETYNANLDKKA